MPAEPAHPPLPATLETADELSSPVQAYLHLTRETLPRLARHPDSCWPVVNDHCFQRIVLDAISGGVWYDHIQRPAYKHLTDAQAHAAVVLCKAIISGDADLNALNHQSLTWRGKVR